MKNIEDIAKIAGVSKSTVSRYLNNGSVSNKTKQKLDKDRFRRGLGGVEEAYEEVWRRITSK